MYTLNDDSITSCKNELVKDILDMIPTVKSKEDFEKLLTYLYEIHLKDPTIY